MNQQTENKMTNPRMTQALDRLNGLPRRKGQGRPLTASDLLDLGQAKDSTGKAALDDWNDLAVFVRVETLVDLYRSLTPKGRDALANNEMVGGWFSEDGDEEADADGEFCSTPCHHDDLPTVSDFAESLDYCSASGVLFIYS